MRYELIPKSFRGVLIDRTPILQDIQDSFEVSFLMPNAGSYLALFKGADGVEYRKPITQGKVKLPNELLAKEQFVELVVCEIDGDKILFSWDCEPLRVTALLNMRRTQWQLSGGMTDRDCYARLIELEKVHSKMLEEFDELKTDITSFTSETSQVVQTLKQKLNEAENTLARLKEVNIASATAYNKAKLLLGGE